MLQLLGYAICELKSQPSSSPQKSKKDKDKDKSKSKDKDTDKDKEKHKDKDKEKTSGWFHFLKKWQTNSITRKYC